MITSPLPLFPLGLVLLPGASVPLHLFEPRYRIMLRDVTASTRRFGLIMPPGDTTEADLPVGRIGCVAVITSVDTMPDGRANIVIEGAERFRFEGYVDVGTPYRMGRVVEHTDLDDEALQLSAATDRVRTLARRAMKASMTIHDATGDMPSLADEPTALSFQVAHMLRVGTEMLYELLAGRSALVRLEQIERAIGIGLQDIEGAATLHLRAKTNGFHHGPPPA